MGATSNPNTTARLAALQERKKTIEETLAERNKELKKLCIQVRLSMKNNCILQLKLFFNRKQS